MHNQQQDVNNLTFFPNIGMGKIKFNHTESDVINILGIPSYKEVDKEVNFINYDYTLFDTKISLFFQYEEKEFDYLSIHTRRLYINNKDISLMDKISLQNFLIKYHESLGIQYDFQQSEDDLEYCYEYPSIGLTIWYEDDYISDICIQPHFV